MSLNNISKLFNLELVQSLSATPRITSQCVLGNLGGVREAVGKMCAKVYILLYILLHYSSSSNAHLHIEEDEVGEEKLEAGQPSILVSCTVPATQRSYSTHRELVVTEQLHNVT
jgi:hypothetical protein